MASAWDDALIAAQLFAIDPVASGGIRLRARAGPVRDRWLDFLVSQLRGRGRPVKLPAHITDERLLGGLDLAATLAAGRPVAQQGLLASADGGVVIVPMAERTAPHVTSALVAAIDTGRVRVERDGMTLTADARFGVILLDEGADADEVPPTALIERIAMTIDLHSIAIGDAEVPDCDPLSLSSLPRVDDDAVTALCSAAMAMGIDSVRAPLLALRIAGLAAASEGASAIDEDHLALAARLVLLPRARCMPPPPEPEADDQPPPPEPDGENATKPDADDPDNIGQMADRVIEAVRSALPPGVLIDLENARASSRSPQTGRGSAGERKSLTRGRPAGVRIGKPGSGARLHLVETLRAAAPWQRIRRATSGRVGVIVHPDDFRLRRFIQKSESTMIFVVDASGSAAMERLGETKGAIELLLAEAYVRRTQVALVAFRGQGAEIVVPPTRSLARARKCLADLAGGGGTPLALGIEAGQALAQAAQSRGRTPFVIVMTDGRANVARDGSHGRTHADADAQAAARVFGSSGIRSVLIDIAARPRDDGLRMAAAMRARYAALPRVEAGRVRDLVAQVQGTIR